ncbi:MAG: HNH endonuclease [Solirubrobacterales bacterium]
MQRDHRVCRYCGGRATEVDHVEPWSRGGLTMMSNLAAACQHCNREKGDRTPGEWEAARRHQAALAAALRKPTVQVRKRPLVKVRPIPDRRPPQRSYLAELLRPR